MEQIELRPEGAEDRRPVEELTREAFWNVYGPGCAEHYLVHIMREDPAFVPELDYVAAQGGQVVGSILYTRAEILGDDGEERPVLCFGPISVLPRKQGQGVGLALIGRTKDLARRMGHRAIVITGDPEYYRRAGFVPAETFGIRTAGDEYAAALLACELEPGALADAAGRFVEAPVYQLDEKAVEEFDQGFPPREKRSGLPSQRRFLELAAQSRPRDGA